MREGETRPHLSYILLAEFDIDEGSVLKHQYPCKTGTNEHLLAEHMLPDGAHDRNDDSTIFYLNQFPELTVDTALLHALDHPAEGPNGADSNFKGELDSEHDDGLLYVLSVVRTKKVATVRRGALVKALAVATHNPYIQIFKPILLLALDDYFKDPSLACLARLYDSINAMDTLHCPQLSLDERLILRTSDRKDMFEEKFVDMEYARTPLLSSFQRSEPSEVLNRKASMEVEDKRSASSESLSSEGDTRSDVSSWKSRPRANTANSSEDSRTLHSTHLTSPKTANRIPRLVVGRPKDTHSSDTTLHYGDLSSPPVPIPTRIPLSTFPGEVGDYSLIKLVQVFSNPGALVTTGPTHSHLHTNGHSTHPIVLLFNALTTHKRVLFLGHGQPAGDVANFVLAACALGSGCGSVLKGFTERAFPYTNLTNLDNLQTIPGFIAGVCNPAFAEKPGWWDVLCNIETGKITVSKDLAPASIPTRSISTLTRSQPLDNGVTGFLDVDEMGKLSSAISPSKADSADNVFMDEIIAAIQSHYGEAVIRARFTDYLSRFVRMASKYEEDIFGSTTIGFPCLAFQPPTTNSAGSLGSGAIYVDEMSKAKELSANAGRIEGFRMTPTYALYQRSFATRLRDSPIRFDLVHQIARLRQGKKLSSAEAVLILRTIASIKSDEGIVAILAQLPPHFGGLLPIAFGLFHPSEVARNATVDFFDNLNAHPSGKKFLQTLNAFHRSAYYRLSTERAQNLPHPFPRSPRPSTTTLYAPSFALPIVS